MWRFLFDSPILHRCIRSCCGRRFRLPLHQSSVCLPVQVISTADEISETVEFEVFTTELAREQASRVERTYERSRLVEMSAIAGIAISQVLWCQIVDVALRGTGAEYLIGPSNELLEVAARSHQTDFARAWNERRERLKRRWSHPAWLCVVEWESPFSRLQRIV